MKFLKSLFEFYIQASIHVALAVTALVGITALEYDFIPSWYLLFFIFFGTITGYNFVKYARIAGMHHRSLPPSVKTIQLFSFTCFIAVLFFGLSLPVAVVGVTSLFGLLTLFYAVPFFQKKNLRKIAGLKIFIVSLVWAGVTVLVPIVEMQSFWSVDMWLTFVQRVLLVVVLTLPFEIRDLNYDAQSLQTFPQLLGVRKTRGIGLAFLVLILLLEGFKDEISLWKLFSLFSMMILCGWVLLVAKRKQSRYFASFGVESIPIVWIVLAIGFRNLFG